MHETLLSHRPRQGNVHKDHLSRGARVFYVMYLLACAFFNERKLFYSKAFHEGAVVVIDVNDGSTLMRAPAQQLS